MSDRCPCIYPDIDPDDEFQTCACGHVLDEHEDNGPCLIDLEEAGR